MVWYVPPLSPVMSLVEGEGAERRPRRRLPGDRRAAHPGAVPRQPARGRRRGGHPHACSSGSPRCAATCASGRSAARPTREWRRAVGMEPRRASRTCTGCCAIAKYDDRYVIPTAHRELAGQLPRTAGRLRAGLRRRPRRLRAKRATREDGEASMATRAPRTGGAAVTAPRVRRRSAARRGERRPAARLAARSSTPTPSCRRPALREAAARCRPRRRGRRPARLPGAPRGARARPPPRASTSRPSTSPRRSHPLPDLPRHGDRRQRGHGAARA